MFNNKGKMLATLLALVACTTAVVQAQEITRNNEGRYFYTSITIPAGAETMYLSGSGARPMDDGTWGDIWIACRLAEGFLEPVNASLP